MLLIFLIFHLSGDPIFLYNVLILWVNKNLLFGQLIFFIVIFDSFQCLEFYFNCLKVGNAIVWWNFTFWTVTSQRLIFSFFMFFGSFISPLGLRYNFLMHLLVLILPFWFDPRHHRFAGYEIRDTFFSTYPFVGFCCVRFINFRLVFFFLLGWFFIFPDFVDNFYINWLLVLRRGGVIWVFCQCVCVVHSWFGLDNTGLDMVNCWGRWPWTWRVFYW